MWAWCHVIGFEESDPCVNDLCTNCLYHTPRSLNGLWQTYWPWDLDPVNYVIKIYISCDYKISPNAKWVQNRNPLSLKLKSKCHPVHFLKWGASPDDHRVRIPHGAIWSLRLSGARTPLYFSQFRGYIKKCQKMEPKMSEYSNDVSTPKWLSHSKFKNSEFWSAISVNLHHGNILTF